MTDPGQFGANKPPAGSRPSGPLDCAAVEVWLAESAEKTLPPDVAEQLHAHATGCAACQEKLAQARRGREWLMVLKQESLEPPAGIVAKILARTSLAGAPDRTDSSPAASDRKALDSASRDRSKHPSTHDDSFPGKDVRRSAELEYIPTGDTAPASGAVPAWQRSSVVVLRRTLLEPRLALVAAMAFFSISLTLNLMGVRLTKLHTADLAPNNMRRAVTRQYAETNARVVRYYENLRIVYEVEARVQQLRRAAETSTQQQQPARPRKQSSDSTSDSSSSQKDSHHERMAANPGAGGDKHAVHPSTLPDPKPVATGPQMDAAFRLPRQQSPFTSGWAEKATGHTLATSLALPYETRFAFQPAPQVLSCSLRTICFSRRYFSTRERRLA